MRRSASDPSGSAGTSSSSSSAAAAAEAGPRKGILRSKTSSSVGGGMDDLAEIEEYRRLRFLPRFARNAWFRQGRLYPLTPQLKPP